MLKILIADHYTIFRIGLIRLVVDASPEVIIEEATDTDTLLNKAAGDNTWDIIISGLSLEEDNYFELIHELKQHAPGASILICGIRAREKYITRLLKAGVSAYIDKGARIASIDQQIKTTLAAKM